MTDVEEIFWVAPPPPLLSQGEEKIRTRLIGSLRIRNKERCCTAVVAGVVVAAAMCCTPPHIFSFPEKKVWGNCLYRNFILTRGKFDLSPNYKKMGRKDTSYYTPAMLLLPPQNVANKIGIPF